jgi:hypothetical protein
MLVISRRVRQFLGTKTIILIRLDNAVVLVVAFLVAFLVAFFALTALIVFVAAVVAVIAVVVVAVIAAVVVVAIAAVVNHSSFLKKTLLPKKPLHELLQGLFSLSLDITDKMRFIG